MMYFQSKETSITNDLKMIREKAISSGKCWVILSLKNLEVVLSQNSSFDDQI